jgi:hypothetical protein
MRSKGTALFALAMVAIGAGIPVGLNDRSPYNGGG